MGPAKGTRIINKAVVKRFVDQEQPEDPHSSNKSKQKKRKIAELDSKWSEDELTNFYESYRQHGKDWKKISLAVGSKSSDMVQSLYSIHQTFLSLPEHQATATGFIALVTGYHSVSDEFTSHRGVAKKVRAYGKARKHVDATEQKANEGAEQHQSNRDRTISGFSSSFKKRYYGELVRKSQIHTVRRRSPRTPVSADRIATDDDMPTFENINNSTKKNAEEINNVCTNFPMVELSPNRNSGITEANKAEQGQSFLDSKGPGDAEIYQSQHFKKIKIQQIIDEDVGMGKVKQETMMAAKEEQSFRDFISEDDMLVLDVLQSLVNAPSKTSKLKINIPSGSHGKTYSTLPHRLEEGNSPIEAKPVSKFRSPKTRQKRHKKVSNAEAPGTSVVNLVGPEAHTLGTSVVNLVEQEAHTVGITELSSCSESKVAMPETSVNTFAEVKPCAAEETNPGIKMSRRSKRKLEMHCKTKYVPCKLPEGSDNLQARKWQHCFSSESLRRWCTYEWFYSAIDYPWFSNNEFVSYLNHANLCHIPRLTRSEWSTVRSSLGKPRRFSDQLLAMEKDKLEDYRNNVRKIYAELSDGSRDSLPADIARPFSIGQQVIVRHPSSRELCDGKVMMVGWDFYKVHFSDPDLGVDIVKDTDCMPVNWLENYPDNMRRSYLSNNTLSILEKEHIPNHAPSENLYHTTIGVSVHDEPKSLHFNPDEKLKFTLNSLKPPSRHVSDGAVLSRGGPGNKCDHNDELDSYVTSFVGRSLSQARQIVDEAMQTNSDVEELDTLNEATDCIGRESEGAFRDARLPSNLISKCIAIIIAIKHLSDSRHPPPSIAGVLERAISMLRPSCPENLAVYKEIESYLSIVANQILALVPTLSSDPALSSL